MCSSYYYALDFIMGGIPPPIIFFTRRMYVEKIKTYIYQYPSWVSLIAVIVLCVLYFLCRGDYGVHNTDDAGMERLQGGLERADERLSDAQSKLSDAQNKFDRAREDASGITREVANIRNSASDSANIINASSNLLEASESRNERMQERFASVEGRSK